MKIDRGPCAKCGWVVQNRNPDNDLCHSCDDSKSASRNFTFSKNRRLSKRHSRLSQNGGYLRGEKLDWSRDQF